MGCLASDLDISQVPREPFISKNATMSSDGTFENCKLLPTNRIQNFKSDFEWGTLLAKINENSRGSGSRPEYERKSSTRHGTPHFSHALHFLLLLMCLSFFMEKSGCTETWNSWCTATRHTVLSVCVLYSTYCINAVCCCTVCGWCSMVKGAVYI